MSVAIPTGHTSAPLGVLTIGLYSDIRVYPDVGISWYARIMRHTAQTRNRDLEHYAVDALRDKAGPVSVDTGVGSAPDLSLDVDGHRIPLDIKAMAYATPERVHRLIRTSPPREVILIVADRINAPARELIESLGWGHLDASTGDLFLHAPGIRIDTTVPALAPRDREARAGIVGPSGRVLAYEILRRHYDRSPDPIRTSTSSEDFGLARSSASDAMRALKAADLVDRHGSPLLPELFWALARVWQPDTRDWLATAPDPDDWDRRADPDAPRWHLGGVEAAVFHGAPAVGSNEGPIDLYVPGATEMTIALRRCGAADPISAAASVATPPVPQLTTSGETRSEMFHRGWPVVHPVAAALDLAALDDARSHQILDEWRPAGEAVWHDA